MKKFFIIVAAMAFFCGFCGCSEVSDSIPDTTVPEQTICVDVATPLTSVATKTTELTTTAVATNTTTLTTSTTVEYLVYNESSKRVHRSNCEYADETMERIEGNHVENGRACDVCKPDVVIDTIYTEPIQTEPIVEQVEPYTYNEVVEIIPSYNYSGDCLTASKGVHYGPSGKETYYNLDMSGCVQMMRNLGYSESEYSVWTDERGVKHFGDYVMVAADLNTRPKGTLVETSLGTGIVVDTGGFAYSNPSQIDVATQW